jgi:hypothetical protein
MLLGWPAHGLIDTFLVVHAVHNHVNLCGVTPS